MKRTGGAKFFVPIAKMDAEERMVYGYASTESVDNQGEIIKIEALRDALDEYMKFANVREMHQNSAVGVCKAAKIDDKGLYVGVHVVDDSAWEKVKSGVYKGFSIGGQAIKKVAKCIEKMRLAEISLVDRPCNPEAVFDLIKLDADADLQKGMYEVSSLAQLLAALNNLRQAAESETLYERDNSQIGEKLKAAIDTLAAILIEMTQEETAELTAKMAQAVDIAKAGARNSKGDVERIQKLHDLTVELGAECQSAADPGPATEKMAGLHREINAIEASLANAIEKGFANAMNKLEANLPAVQEAMKKSATTANELLPTLMKRLDALEQQPLPVKVSLKGVTKADDIDKNEPGFVKSVEAEADQLLQEIKKNSTSPTSAY